MANPRIRISTDKVELVKLLTDQSTNVTPFSSMAALLTFAAALGLRQGKKTPLNKAAKEPAPIRQEVFKGLDLDIVLDIAGVLDSKDFKILGKGQDNKEIKARVFEEYANTGLDILQDKLKGYVDTTEITDKLIFLINKNRKKQPIESKQDLDVIDLVT